MKNLFILLILMFLTSCKEKPEPGDFNDRILDFAIANAEDKFIELPDLYPKSMTMSLENEEKFILSEKLKRKGFAIKSQTAGIYSVSGIKVITAVLNKAFCDCEVRKTYYPTPFEGQYKVTEKVRCLDVTK